ncbi:MAG: RNA polymerase sigma factor [Vicinamibacterales bacterium]
MESEDEAAVVAGLRSGDTAVFDRVYELYRPRLFAFLLRLSRRRTVAEDLLDETWLRLVTHARSLRADTRLAAWLFTVARNLYWTYRRSSLLEEAAAVELLTLWPARENWPSPFDLASMGELGRRVERAVATLPPLYREALLLVAYEGLTPTEAAAVCRVTPETLRQRLARARAALAERLDLPPRQIALKRSNRT